GRLPGRAEFPASDESVNRGHGQLLRAADRAGPASTGRPASGRRPGCSPGRRPGIPCIVKGAGRACQVTPRSAHYAPLLTDDRNAAQYAAAIAEARQRLISFAGGCSDGDWNASPLDGDPRPVGVVVDHVAHSYEY